MHDRVVALDRVLNFRDFGGYDAREGRVVRGRLYRSAHFADASDADMQTLDALNVAVVVDLRRPEERVREPNRWPGAGGRTIANDEGRRDVLPPHLQALLQDNLTADGVAAYMRAIYREFAFEPRHIDLYRAWFGELQSASGAMVIHCAAGKDRTGLGCALTLHALGVDEGAILADYEFTNAVLDLDRRLPRIRANMEARLGRSLADEALRPMLGVDADYLHGAFAAIRERAGSLDAYLETTLGVGAPAREALRARYVTAR